MGHLLAAVVLILAAAPASAQVRVVNSRADLLLGTSLDTFYDFERNGSGWSGDGTVQAGVLRLEAPFVGDGAGAYRAWEGGDPFAIEWEARPVGGPFEAEHALLLGYEPPLQGVRVRFSYEGNVSVDRVRGAAFETVAPWTAVPSRGAAWTRYAVRVYRGRLSVVVAGEEVLNAILPPLSGGAIGFHASPGAVSEFDHVALYEAARPAAAPAPTPAERAVFIESFSIGRDEWGMNLFPARAGALRVAALEGEVASDLLGFPLPEACRVEVFLRLAGAGSAGLLFHAREEEGGRLSGYECRVGPDGTIDLYINYLSGERLVARGGPPAAFRPDGWNRLSFRRGASGVRIAMNGELLIDAKKEDALAAAPEGRFGVTARPGDDFELDEVLVFSPERAAPFDTAAAAELWREVETLSEQRALATKSDRVRELFLLAPSLPGILDLLFREAGRAGDGETALAAADALADGREGASEEAKLRILALALLRRWDQTYAELQRLRSLQPDDPFALENALLVLDRTGRYERLAREYRAAVAGAEPLRASGHGVAAWAYLRSQMPDRALEALRVATRLGPGRLDLSLVEGDLLRAKGDLDGALARYEAILAGRLSPVPDENVRARFALVRFEQGAYREAADALATLPAHAEAPVQRSREILRAVALYRGGLDRGPDGRLDLEGARAIAFALISDPPASNDAAPLDLLGRIDATLALLDLQGGESYPVYREKTRRALELCLEAARLDPSFPTPNLEENTVPDLDPTRFRSLLYSALGDDHPVGGFVEDVARWGSWSIADRRADLAERVIDAALGGDGSEAKAPREEPGRP